MKYMKQRNKTEMTSDCGCRTEGMESNENVWFLIINLIYYIIYLLLWWKNENMANKMEIYEKRRMTVFEQQLEL